MARRIKYPFAELEIGQRFVIPLDEITAQSARSITYQWGKRLDRSFACHVTEDGYSIERVAPSAPSAYEITVAPRRGYSTLAEQKARAAEVANRLSKG